VGFGIDRQLKTGNGRLNWNVMDDKPRKDGIWTILALCLGLALIAACVIVPQLDPNRRLDYQRRMLLADLDQINRQTAINEQFLGRLESDPQLAQRLAQRQMKFIRQGESLLSYKGQPTVVPVSPYSLVHVPPPAAVLPYTPAGGAAAQFLLDDHVRLYVLAAGLFLAAVGLVLSSNDARASGTCD
jgi:hypothetical protein